MLPSTGRSGRDLTTDLRTHGEGSVAGLATAHEMLWG